MDISENEFDNTSESILGVINGVGQIWETVDDDPEKISMIKKAKPYYFLINEYKDWIKNLEKADFSYTKVLLKRLHIKNHD
ncbi:25219_t:CDS:2 [Cetraspora pellucida]|uniref:25219_t:CDS:1 n=1 Tax=Cetraspora pellucida TaxID=1433469 RepID=A0A9N9EU84_9GLOM|nr:25219_t:CDS:2 [Cetraspora pellucida]